MSITYIPQNNSHPTIFKLIPRMFLCFLVCIIIPILLILLTNELIVFFASFLLKINLKFVEQSFIVMIFPAFYMFILFCVLSFYLQKTRYILIKINFGLREEW
jgi:hypothetical protein